METEETIILDSENYKLKIDELRQLLKSSKTFEQAIKLALEVHALTHTARVSSASESTYCDELCLDLKDEDYSVMPTKKDETIAWQLWHIARIEDLVGNLLIARQAQILDRYSAKLQVKIRDTGNVMSDEEIIDFSRRVDKSALLNYRDEVGRQTRKIIDALTPADLKRKPAAADLERLVSEGGLLKAQGSLWLKDFWGKHSVAGLVLLPLTRHHMMHLPDSMRIKQFIYHTVK